MPCFPDPGGTPPRAGSERGSTLVGVMAAGVVLGAMALGLANLWTVFDRLSFDALLRQKAVFVLNGEMERLSALYATTNFGWKSRSKSTGYAALSGIAGSSSRRIYAVNSTGADFAVSTVAAFDDADTNLWVSGSGTSARNYVWLDRGRGLTARLSWIECGIKPAGGANCWGRASDDDPEEDEPENDETRNKGCFAYKFAGNPNAQSGGAWCRHLVLVLEYPFRIEGPTATQAGQGVMTLSTIVGRRA
jgi:hypothetical protein